MTRINIIDYTTTGDRSNGSNYSSGNGSNYSSGLGSSRSGLSSTTGSSGLSSTTGSSGLSSITGSSGLTSTRSGLSSASIGLSSTTSGLSSSGGGGGTTGTRVVDSSDMHSNHTISIGISAHPSNGYSNVTTTHAVVVSDVDEGEEDCDDDDVMDEESDDGDCYEYDSRGSFRNVYTYSLDDDNDDDDNEDDEDLFNINSCFGPSFISNDSGTSTGSRRNVECSSHSTSGSSRNVTVVAGAQTITATAPTAATNCTTTQSNPATATATAAASCATLEIGRTVHIIGGSYRGQYGTIRKITKSRVLVVLNALNNHITGINTNTAASGNEICSHPPQQHYLHKNNIQVVSMSTPTTGQEDDSKHHDKNQQSIPPLPIVATSSILSGRGIPAASSSQQQQYSTTSRQHLGSPEVPRRRRRTTQPPPQQASYAEMMDQLKKMQNEVASCRNELKETAVSHESALVELNRSRAETTSYQNRLRAHTDQIDQQRHIATKNAEIMDQLEKMQNEVASCRNELNETAVSHEAVLAELTRSRAEATSYQNQLRAHTDQNNQQRHIPTTGNEINNHHHDIYRQSIPPTPIVATSSIRSVRGIVVASSSQQQQYSTPSRHQLESPEGRTSSRSATQPPYQQPQPQRILPMRGQDNNNQHHYIHRQSIPPLPPIVPTFGWGNTAASSTQQQQYSTTPRQYLESPEVCTGTSRRTTTHPPQQRVRIIGGTHIGKMGTVVKCTDQRVAVLVDGEIPSTPRYLHFNNVEYIRSGTSRTTTPQPPPPQRLQPQQQRVWIIAGVHTGKMGTFVKNTDQRVAVLVDGETPPTPRYLSPNSVKFC